MKRSLIVLGAFGALFVASQGFGGDRQTARVKADAATPCGMSATACPSWCPVPCGGSCDAGSTAKTSTAD